MRISDWSSDVCSSDLRELRDPRITDPAWPHISPAPWDGGTAARRPMSPGRSSWSLPQHMRGCTGRDNRSEEHTSELQSLMRISYAVFCLKKKTTNTHQHS